MDFARNERGFCVGFAWNLIFFSFVREREGYKHHADCTVHLSIANGFISSKIYDKRDDFDFDIVNFPFLDGDVPLRASYGVYISQLIRFARVCNHVADFNA